MPCETRTGKLIPGPLPGECFAKDTWTQADFLDPRLRLPSPDKFFDFSVCGHTVEDLENPRPLLAELRRVSSAGYIETPSRLSEQTRGSRDRMTAAQGHPHHHWIVESENKRLLLSAKSSTVQEPGPLHAIPLRTYERMISRKSASPIQSFPWENDFEVVVLPADEVTRRARLAVDFCSISRADRLLDPIVRNLRRIKYGRFHSTAHETRSWWEHMLTISRPYSKIPL